MSEHEKQFHLLDLVALGLADCIGDMLSQSLSSLLHVLVFFHELCREPAKHFNKKIIAIGFVDHCNDALPLLASQEYPIEMRHGKELLSGVELVVGEDHDTVENKRISKLMREMRQYQLQSIR
jgi:hypothetical protein